MENLINILWFLKNLPMRPFLSSILKCQKCKSEKFQKIEPEEIKKVPLPAYFPKIEEFKEEQDFLRDLIDSVSRKHSKTIDITEADLYTFLESESEKINELLFGIDVVTGTVTCIECGDIKNIKNSILFCEE